MNKKALSLLEVALVLTVIAIAFVGISRMMADTAGATRAKVVAERMEQIADAAQAYISTNRSAIQTFLTANPTATISIPVAKQTEIAGQPTGTAGFQSIQAAGFLPPGFVDRTSNGQSHALLIKAAPGSQIDAMLIAYGGDPIADKDLTTIVTSIGAAGGAVYDEMTVTPDTHIVGAQAGWSYATNQWAGSIDGSAVAPVAGRPAVSVSSTQEQNNARSGSATVSAAGTAIDITDIPESATKVTVILDQLSLTNDGPVPLIQLGTSSGIETTGYTSQSVLLSSSGSGANVTPAMIGGFLQTALNYRGWQYVGSMTLERISDNTWVATGYTGIVNGGWQHYLSTGRKTLSAPLSRLRITTAAGTNVFDLGTIKVFWEQ